MEQETVQSALQTRDWIQIICTLFLGLSALTVPWVVYWLGRRKEKLNAPRLRIDFLHQPPYSHKTLMGGRSSVYYFRFRVVNEGKSQARFCEAVLEELWLSNGSERFEDFIPVNLQWAGYGKETPRFVPINPGRDTFFALGRIPKPGYQKEHEKSAYYSGTQTEANGLFFEISKVMRYYSQPDCLLPRTKARIKISICSENAPKVEEYFDIEWKGGWTEGVKKMLRDYIRITHSTGV